MPERDQRPALNCLRGLAALVVLLYHFRFYADFPVIARYPWLAFGPLGVDFFFILSGLIISHVYFSAFAAGLTSYREFLFLRLSRLLPVHAFVMIAMLAGALVAGREVTGSDMADWLSLTLLFRQWLLPDGYAWNSAAWSVSAEMFAYAAVFPVVVFATRRLQPLTAAGTLLALGWFLYLLLSFHYGDMTRAGGSGPLLRVTAGFLLGAGLYRLLAHRALSAGADLVLFAGGALVILAVAVLEARLMVVIGLVLTIAGAYLSRGPLGRAMAHRVPFYLGEISFSLYLVHLPLLRVGKAGAEALGAERGPLFCLVMLGVALLAAALLYETVEVPARRAMRRRWSQRQAVRALQPAG